MTDKHLDELAIALQELAASSKPPSHDASSQPKACPVCGEQMELIRQFDIVIDVCGEHGVWLDQGELALMLERTYWFRRDIEDRPERDPMRVMDQTRKRFVASLNRVAGCVGR